MILLFLQTSYRVIIIFNKIKIPGETCAVKILKVFAMELVAPMGYVLPFRLPKKIVLIVFAAMGFTQVLRAQTDSSKHKKVVTLTDSITSTRTFKRQLINNNLRNTILAPYNLFLNQEYSSYLEEGINDTDYNLHTAFRPIIQPEADRYVNIDSLRGCQFPAKKRSWLYRKLYQENLFIIRDSASKFYCTIDPLFNFQGSADRSDSNKKFYQNTRGILVQGNVGNKFAFSSSFWENQADYPTYLNQFIADNYVVPGNGRPKLFGTNGYDFSMSEAYLSYSPSSHFNFQGGYGKNFIGDGYRSLFLSDNSFAYPYIRVTTTFWHIQYTNLYTEFLDPFADPSILQNNEGLFQRKAGAFQYLSWNVTPKMEWGFFQGMIWPTGNRYNQMALNANYFNPLIFANTWKYGFNNTPNMLVGAALKYKFSNHFMIYGQLLINDFPKELKLVYFDNQTAHQTGVKYYNSVGKFNFIFQLEYNEVRPYTYASKDSLDNYSNYNQSLADPMGANFRELIGILHLRYDHFSINLQLNYAQIGLDSNHANFGSNIFNPIPPNSPHHLMLAGEESTMIFMDAHISYLLNPRTNMNFTVGISHRTYTSINNMDNQPAMTLIYVGFRTSIDNMYVDF